MPYKVHASKAFTFRLMVHHGISLSTPVNSYEGCETALDQNALSVFRGPFSRRHEVAVCTWDMIPRRLRGFWAIYYP